MEEFGLLKHIEACNYRLIYNDKSLRKYLNNTVCEGYNSLVAKFIGGKHINFSCRGSYEMRCNAAAISFNSKGRFHGNFHKSVTTRSPGLYTKILIKKY